MVYQYKSTAAGGRYKDADFASARASAIADARAAYFASESRRYDPPKQMRSTADRHDEEMNAMTSSNSSFSAAAETPSDIQALGSLRSLAGNMEMDDIVIIALFWLLFNENKEDDILVLLILAVLFFT